MMKMMMTNAANTLYEVQPENQGDLWGLLNIFVWNIWPGAPVNHEWASDDNLGWGWWWNGVQSFQHDWLDYNAAEGVLPNNYK